MRVQRFSISHYYLNEILGRRHRGYSKRHRYANRVKIYAKKIQIRPLDSFSTFIQIPDYRSHPPQQNHRIPIPQCIARLFPKLQHSTPLDMIDPQFFFLPPSMIVHILHLQPLRSRIQYSTYAPVPTVPELAPGQFRGRGIGFGFHVYVDTLVHRDLFVALCCLSQRIERHDSACGG